MEIMNNLNTTDQKIYISDKAMKIFKWMEWVITSHFSFNFVDDA
jgi:hypothetical protein